MSFISDLLINVSAFRITIGNKINALKILIDGKQNALTNGLHTILNGNKVDVTFDVNAYVKDKSNNDRLFFGNTSSIDVIIKGAVANGDFKVKDSTDADLFRMNGSNKVPYFPQLPAPQTLDANLAIIDSGNGLWKHNVKISDLVTTSVLGNYYTKTESNANFHKLAKTNAEATSAGYYSILTNVDADTILGNVSIYPGAGSTNVQEYSHLISYGVTAIYGWQFNKIPSNNELRVRTRVNGVYTAWDTVAYQSWVTQQITNAGGNYITTNTTQTGLSGNKTTSGVWTLGQIRKAGQNDTQMLLAGGGHRPVSDFALAGSLAGYLPLAGGTMNGTINTTINNILNFNGSNRIQVDGASIVLGGNTTGSGGIYFRPQGTSITTNQVNINGLGVITTFNGNGDSSQWKQAFDWGDFRDFGLGLSTNSNYVVNADTHNPTSFGVTASSFVGSPFVGVNGSNQGYLNTLVWGTGNNYKFQEHIPVNSAIARRYRIKNNGVWGSWVTGIDSNNLDSQATALGFIKSSSIPAQVNLIQGAGIGITGTYPNLTITNSAPNATHTGDVTGSTALTIATSAVTFPKMQNIATQTFLGRATAGTGNVEALTVAQMQTLLGFSTQTLSNSTSNLIVSNTVQRAALTGDVTAAQNSNATTIANSAVTNAKMANMAANTFKGRITTAGAPQDLTVAQMVTALGVTDTTIGANNTNYTSGAINFVGINGVGVGKSGNTITISGSGSGGGGITNISTDDPNMPGPTSSNMPIVFNSHVAYGKPETAIDDLEVGNGQIWVESGDVVRFHHSFDNVITFVENAGKAVDIDTREIRKHICNVVFIPASGSGGTVTFGAGVYTGDQINVTVPRGQGINLQPYGGINLISSAGQEVQTHANLIWDAKIDSWVLVGYD